MENKTIHIYTIELLLLIFIISSCQHSGNKSIGKKQENTENERIAIELILKEQNLSDSLLLHLKETRLNCYKWKNHIVLFGYPKDTIGTSKLISTQGINLHTKYYNQPMYVFDKAIHCDSNKVVKPWKDYLLTANLVNDTIHQKEYIKYHNNQLKEWPEVAQGFCHADFQQLIVYKNGRQLLLVISIPADKTLDELNPKTIENNPRMVEWNKIMSEYQEGIEGTNPGETWVFLDKIDLSN